MNHPFGGCYSHFQEVADLTDKLRRYRDQPAQTKNNNMQSMDLQANMDVDATFMEHNNLGEHDWSRDGRPFVEEYQGAAKEYGMGTTFMEEFDHDQYAGEHIENLYYPFVSRDEWEFAAFLLHSDLSMASINSLLSLNLVRGSLVTLTTCTATHAHHR